MASRRQSGARKTVFSFRQRAAQAARKTKKTLKVVKNSEENPLLARKTPDRFSSKNAHTGTAHVVSRQESREEKEKTGAVEHFWKPKTITLIL
jgi:hypothetical protein